VHFVELWMVHLGEVDAFAFTERKRLRYHGIQMQI
jgi:hypothetical protein